MTTQAQQIASELPPLVADVPERPGRVLSPLALRALVGIFDAAIVALAFLGATAIAAPDMADIDLLPFQIPVVCALMIAGLTFQGAYEFKRIRNGHQVLSRLTLGAIVGLGFVILASYVLPEITVARRAFVLHGALAVSLLVLWRRFLFHSLREAALRPRAVILGDLSIARKIAQALSSAHFCGAEVVGILPPPAYARLREVVARHRVSQAIVVGGSTDGNLPVDALVELREDGIMSVEDGCDAYEAATGKILVEKLTPGWLVFANAFERSKLETLTRRVLGIVIAGSALIVMSPFLLAIAVLIKLDSAGPVLFRQERVGQGGKLFELLKFRTMRQDAEAATGPVWAQAKDPRVTRLGRFLRSTRIDELPQLWNVVRGDMYFVGPRPERPHFVEMLRREIPFYDQRHSVKPGITGWAQINYRYGATIEDTVEKLHYDLFYIQNMSGLLDLYIVLGTIRVMLGASNQN